MLVTYLRRLKKTSLPIWFMLNVRHEPKSLRFIYGLLVRPVAKKTWKSFGFYAILCLTVARKTSLDGGGRNQTQKGTHCVTVVWCRHSMWINVLSESDKGVGIHIPLLTSRTHIELVNLRRCCSWHRPQCGLGKGGRMDTEK